ncbi:D-glycero-beta-D-manno-heptose 1-phosphate adenylyltransferase (EC / D-glycero-beta-D-manno-heptose-7-phosphate kinase (EC [Olavius algarvensis associated proteobacterium Delta 3]|nr:D-glycero-beta-D-manno-heptose 1-phosphate adenylyltransferase (EC / D-glycero-beta-D-manno-heptose-7-phosphate kinase (EC [Olavius algarvensis associated proteobacterium Delta 3]
MTLTENISRFSQCRVLVVGDLMIDHYVWGEVDRISPEAPVQVVNVRSEEDTLGGCGNVVNNIVALGGSVAVAGVVGSGRYGQLLIERLRTLGVDVEGVIREPERPTTRKTRIFASNQHVVRIDRESRERVSKETLEKLAAEAEKKLPASDVVLISDYGKGVVTRELLRRICDCARKHGKITIADPKGMDFAKYSGVDVLTPNKKEAGLAAAIDISDDDTLHNAGEKLLDSLAIEMLLVTCGKDGMVLFKRGARPYRIPAKARQVYEVSGAGDTVAAVLGLAVAAGANLRDAAALANTAAGVVVGKVGTATLSQKELEAAFKPSGDRTVSKYKQFHDLPVLVQELRKKGKKIVLTNGCFDLLHAGHVMLFSASKQLGDVLFVATDDDDSVRALKGPGRPVIQARERVRVLCALDSVDYVVIFSSGRLKDLIRTIRPDVLTKGSNYDSEEVAGRELVETLGGRVALVPISEDTSSTRIISNIRNTMD